MVTLPNLAMISILVLLLNIAFSTGKESNGIDWKKKPTFSSTPVDIDLSKSKLLLKTKAEWRSDLVVNFKDSRAGDAGSFKLEFSNPPKYGFIDCTSSSFADKILPGPLPKPDKSGYIELVIEQNRIGGQGLKISCNGTTLLDFNPQKDVCSYRRWDSYWTKRKIKFDFRSDRAVSYYSVIPYKECEKLNMTLAGMTTKPELPVKHGVNVTMKCPKRTVNMGGESGVCMDGVVVASSGSPVCLPETTVQVTTPAQRVTKTPAKPIDWTKKPSRGMKIDLSSTKLLLRTKAKSGDELRLNFEDSRGSGAGKFGLDFSSSPKYDFSECTALSVSRASSPLKKDLPKPDEAGYRVFEVMKYGQSGRGLKISCNGVELITFEPSDDVCKGWSFWKSTWEKEKAKVNFTFDDVIQYVATVPYHKEKKDRYITSA